MGGDRSGRIGSSISARRTRRKPSTKEIIKAATKEPRLKDDAMRAVVGKEKRGNSNSYMPRNSRGRRPVGFRLGHRQLELEAGPWKLSGSNAKDPSTETNKRPLHGCEPVPKRDPGFAAPLWLKPTSAHQAGRQQPRYGSLRGDTINLAAVPTNWKLLSFDTTCKFYLRYSQRHRHSDPLHRKVSRSNRQQSSGAQQPDDARHTRHEKPGHAIDMAKKGEKGGSENTGKKAQGQARKAEAAAQKSAAAEADKEAAEATKWDKGAKSAAKK